MRSFMDACGAKCYNETAEHLREAIRDAVLPMLLSATEQAAAPAGTPAKTLSPRPHIQGNPRAMRSLLLGAALLHAASAGAPAVSAFIAVLTQHC